MTHTYSEGVIGLFLLLLLFFVPTAEFPFWEHHNQQTRRL